MGETSLNGTVYDFSVDPGAIGKGDIPNSYKYLVKRKNIK